MSYQSSEQLVVWYSLKSVVIMSLICVAMFMYSLPGKNRGNTALIMTYYHVIKNNPVTGKPLC